MFLSPWPWSPFPIIQGPVPVFIAAALQIAYLVWVFHSLLQVLRVEPLAAGWKLYWQAVIVLLPMFGPLIWLFSLHNPRRFSVFWGKRFGVDRK